MNALNFKQFKMYNPDLDILTMVTEFISTLYYAKYIYIKKTCSMFRILMIWDNSLTILSAREIYDS